MRAIVGGMDYINFNTFHSMIAHLGNYKMGRDMVERAVDGMAVLKVDDTLHLIQKYGISWDKMARRHSAETALRMVFKAIPIPPYVRGKRYDDEVSRCHACL